MPTSDAEMTGFLPASKATVRALMKKAHIPGMSIATLSEGNLSESSAFGVASLQSGESVTKDTIFPAASLSKPVFAYLVLKLIEKGELEPDFLDQPLYLTLPEYKPFFINPSVSTLENIRFDDSDEGRAVTARFILSHRTGLDNWINPNSEKKFEFHGGYDLCAMPKESDSKIEWDKLYVEVREGNLYYKVKSPSGIISDSITSAELGHALTTHTTIDDLQSVLPNIMKITSDKDHTVKPGKKFRYSGEGFHYLQEVVQKRTRKSLQELAKTHVFDPIGMHHSNFRTPEEENPRIAVGHDTEMNPKHVTGKPEENAAASLLTTSSDYVRFLAASLNEKDPIYREYLEPTVLVTEDLTVRESVGWSLGWGLQKTDHGRVAFHWGDVPNCKAFTAINLNDGSAIVYFANSENGLAISQEVVDVLAPSIGSLKPSLDYLADKYGYQKYDDTPGWEQRYDALVAEIKGDYESAIERFTEALALNPDDKMTKRHLEWLTTLMRVQANPVILEERALKGHQGQYGPLLITLEEEQLQIEVNGQKHRLIPQSNTTFLDIDDKVRLEFNNNKIPPVLNCRFMNGDKVEFSRLPLELGLFRIDTKDPLPTQPNEARRSRTMARGEREATLVTLKELSADELLAVQERMQSFKARIPHEPPTETGKIILLCGTSTAGKTSICTAAQSEASKTGHSWIVDGADVASEKAWIEPCELAGKRYLSAQDHFVNAMKTHADPSVVDTAASMFGARTLAVALFSRRCLGNPKVDQVDLTPEADIKTQATKIYDALSPENKEQYTPDGIENLLSIIRDCPDTGAFFTEHPYPPLQQLNEHMLERAITRAKRGASTILDVIGNETINNRSMVDQFQERLKAAGLPGETGVVAIAHCPVGTLIDRIDGRNTKAIAEGRTEDVRQAFFPFDQYGAIYEKAPKDPDSTKPIVGIVSREDITNAARIFGRGEDDAMSLIEKLEFTDGEESISVISRVKIDTIFQTGTQSSQQIAEHLCEKVFGSPPVPHDTEMRVAY